MAAPTKDSTDDLKEQLETLRQDVNTLVSTLSSTTKQKATRTAEELSEEIARLSGDLEAKGRNALDQAEGGDHREAIPVPHDRTGGRLSDRGDDATLMLEELSHLLTRRASRAAKSGVREVIARSAGLIVAGLLFVAAFLFGLLAIFHSFASTYGPVTTAAMMCFGLLTLAAITLLLADRKATKEKAKREANTEMLENGVKTAMSLVGQIGAGAGSGKGKLALPLIGLVVGFLLATRSDDDDSDSDS